VVDYEDLAGPDADSSPAVGSGASAAHASADAGAAGETPPPAWHGTYVQQGPDPATHSSGPGAQGQADSSAHPTYNIKHNPNAAMYLGETAPPASSGSCSFTYDDVFSYHWFLEEENVCPQVAQDDQTIPTYTRVELAAPIPPGVDHAGKRQTCKASPSHALSACHACVLAAVQATGKGDFRRFEADATANASAVSPVSELLLRKFLLRDRTRKLSGLDVLVQLDTEQSREDALLLCLLEPGDNRAALEEDTLLEDALLLDLLEPTDTHAALRCLASEQARQTSEQEHCEQAELLQTRSAPQKEGDCLKEPHRPQELNASEFADHDVLEDVLEARLSVSQKKMQMLLARAARIRHRLACSTSVAEETAKVSAAAHAHG